MPESRPLRPDALKTRGRAPGSPASGAIAERDEERGSRESGEVLLIPGRCLCFQPSDDASLSGSKVWTTGPTYGVPARARLRASRRSRIAASDRSAGQP